MMDYNRFVERVRKMYPNGRENSFDIEVKKEKESDTPASSARSDDESSSNADKTNNGQNRIVQQQGSI